MAVPLYVDCLSLFSPVGNTPESAAAALRAGISAFEKQCFRDNTGDCIVGAAIGGLPESYFGGQRIAALLEATVTSARERLTSSGLGEPMHLTLCVAEGHRNGAAAERRADALKDVVATAFPRSKMREVAMGPVSVFAALAYARSNLSDANAQTCLVLAVDSLLNARTLSGLERARRLKTPSNSDGIIPGESAGALLVSATPFTGYQLQILGLGFAKESATILNDEPLLGEGFVQAGLMALGECGLAMHEVDFRVSDVAGESYAFEELVLSHTRLMRKTRPCQVLWHPADCVGDCGAATAVIQLAWAGQAFRRGYAPGDVAALHASAATGNRAIALVSSPTWSG